MLGLRVSRCGEPASGNGKLVWRSGWIEEMEVDLREPAPAGRARLGAGPEVGEVAVGVSGFVDRRRLCDGLKVAEGGGDDAMMVVVVVLIERVPSWKVW
jgi:hypothetical protein